MATAAKIITMPAADDRRQVITSHDWTDPRTGTVRRYRVRVTRWGAATTGDRGTRTEYSFDGAVWFRTFANAARWDDGEPVVEPTGGPVANVGPYEVAPQYADMWPIDPRD